MYYEDCTRTSKAKLFEGIGECHGRCGLRISMKLQHAQISLFISSLLQLLGLLRMIKKNVSNCRNAEVALLINGKLLLASRGRAIMASIFPFNIESMFEMQTSRFEPKIELSAFI